MQYVIGKLVLLLSNPPYVNMFFAQDATAVDHCPGGSLFGLPPWYKYLKGTTTHPTLLEAGRTVCTPQFTGLNDIWLVGAAVLEMLLRIAALIAIGMVVYGGVRFITSQAEPEKLKAARGTIINGIIGLVVAVTATGVVTFIAGRF